MKINGIEVERYIDVYDMFLQRYVIFYHQLMDKSLAKIDGLDTQSL